MKLILKQKEPKNLKNHRQKAGTTYESFCRDDKLGDIQPPSGFRKHILEEQGYLCAYCMRRIPHKHIEKGIEHDDMKIEHRISQKNDLSISEKLDITHSNMFACCMGGEGKQKKFQTCDTRKGENSISINPTNKLHVNTINYSYDGLIISTDSTFDSEINNILNLNEKNLKNQREAIYQSVEKKTKEILKKLMDRKAKNEYLNREIELWIKATKHKNKEYCMVAVAYLQSRIIE